MSISEQVDALQQRTAKLKSSAEQAQHETDEQVKARIDQTKADICPVTDISARSTPSDLHGPF